MPIPDIRNHDYPAGPLRDKLVIDISAADYVNESGFICQVVDAGDLTYHTLYGAGDVSETGLAAGDTISVSGVPVLLRAVRATSTVTEIAVGIL